jgi:molybdopterin synthase catalytic subunit
MSVQILVEYFAAARELAGVADEVVIIEALPLTAAELGKLLRTRHPRLAPHLARMRFAVNDELVGLDAQLSPGDRVAVLPPVAGGSQPRPVLRSTTLSIDEAVAAVSHPGAGGIAVFLGVVRDHADGKQVKSLSYEAHPSLAEKEIARVCAAVEAREPGVRVCVLHRIGELAIGELAVVVAASAAHRAQAFSACRAAIDSLKETVPIWKKEWGLDGAAHWVNLEG